jgi:3-oxoacyl-[acyl-carrier protein] reductase
MAGVKGRTAIVTGAGNPDGIGYAIAKALVAAGANVVVTSTTARIHKRSDELGVPQRSRGYVADLTKADAASGLVDFAVSEFGGLDILVNNAGMQQTGVYSNWPGVDELGEEDWALTLSLSLSTCYLTTRAAIPHLRKSGSGRIVNMSLVSGPVAIFHGGGAYAAAKAAMVGYTRSLALELGRDGITANAIAPGWIDNGRGGKELLVAGKNTPVGRAGRPDELGSLALYLASEECSYVTGQMIVIDGGNTIQEYKGPGY